MNVSNFVYFRFVYLCVRAYFVDWYQFLQWGEGVVI